MTTETNNIEVPGITWTTEDAFTYATQLQIAKSQVVFQMVSALSLAAFRHIYWTGGKPDDNRKGYTERRDTMLGHLGKSRKYQYRDLCAAFTSHLLKQFGSGKGADVSQFWQTVQRTENVQDATALLVNYIKVDLQVNNEADLLDALKTGKKSVKPTTSFKDKTLKAAEKALGDGELTLAELLATIEALNDLVTPTMEMRLAA